jgi:hypothetical protein
MSNVVPLHPPQPLLAGYLRVGHDGHRRLPHMLNVGRLKYKRFVFEAALKIEDEVLKKALKENKKRLQRMQEALMTVARGNLSFSKVPAFRGGKNKINAVMAG